MSIKEYQCEVLFRPATLDLRFLPEGPYVCGATQFSWVAIQHAANATSGSLNVFDVSTRTNQQFLLPGRPGFAFPTSQPNEFVIGLERHLGVYNIGTRQWLQCSNELEQSVTGTIINDGVVIDGGLFFGCKDVTFQEQKAGLYLWRSSDNSTHRLRGDQICSNGKIAIGTGDRQTLLDIDTPTRKVVRYELNVSDGTLSEAVTAIDLTDITDYPDGMIATPDGQSVIIAFYNPADVDAGQARQYSLSDGRLEAVWHVPRSPRVTCPLLMEIDGRVRLILTTADEGMTDEQRARHTNAGCLFIADTEFESATACPVALSPSVR